MKRLLYLSAVLLLTGWLVGVLIYTMGALIHLLLVLSIVLILLLSRMDRKVHRHI